VRPRVRYNPNDINVTSATTPSVKVRVNAGVTNPMVEVAESIATYTPASGAAVTINASNQTVAEIQQNNTAAFNINAPTQPAKGRVLRVVLINGSAGTISPTWNAAFAFDGSAPAPPAAGKHKSVSFEYDGTNWREIGRSG
jgi:hypothetical protein